MRARFDLDMDNAATGAPFPALCTQPPPIEWVPTVVDFNDLPEMGRVKG